MTTSPFLSVIVPVYNEEPHIQHTLDSIYTYGNQLGQSIEVIVVDDASRDATAQILAAYKEHQHDLHILTNIVNRGKGYSVRRGMRKATGTYCLFMDGDNSVTIDHFDTFMRQFENGASVVIGSIAHAEATVVDHNHRYRRFLGSISKHITHLFTGLDVADTQRGFKAFTHEAKKIIFPRQTIYRWGFDIELLVIARIHDLLVIETPVTWENPDNSEVTLASYFTTFIELLKIKLNEIRGRYQ